MVECWTGMPLMQVRFPCAARDFSPSVNFQCRLLYMSVHPHVQSQALTSMGMLKILLSMSEFVDYGNTKTPGMHHK